MYVHSLLLLYSTVARVNKAVTEHVWTAITYQKLCVHVDACTCTGVHALL